MLMSRYVREKYRNKYESAKPQAKSARFVRFFFQLKSFRLMTPIMRMAMKRPLANENSTWNNSVSIRAVQIVPTVEKNNVNRSCLNAFAGFFQKIKISDNDNGDNWKMEPVLYGIKTIYPKKFENTCQIISIHPLLIFFSFFN